MTSANYFRVLVAAVGRPRGAVPLDTAVAAIGALFWRTAPWLGWDDRLYR